MTPLDDHVGESPHNCTRLVETCRKMRELERVPLRNRLYGRSRMNGWPLWISWLLAGTPDSRRICRELMQLRKAGVDV